VAELRAARRALRIVSPRLLGTGDMLTVPGSHPISTVRGLPEDATVEDIAGTGVMPVGPETDFAAFARERRTLDLDGIKIVIESGPEPWYPKPRMSVELAARITRAARGEGLPVYAHVSSLDELEDAVAADVHAVIHSVHDRIVPDETIEAMVARRIWSVPTLNIYSQVDFTQHPEGLDDPFLRAGVQPRALRSLENPLFLHFTRNAFGDDPEVFRQRAFENLRRMHAAGVPIAAGSDAAGVPFSFPGFALHRDLAWMVDAGLSPAQALRAATADAARMLGIDERVGRAETGMRADLVLLDANPLVDIRNTRRIRAVVLAGRCIPPITAAPEAACPDPGGSRSRSASRSERAAR
jgi:hypothetical protein